MAKKIFGYIRVSTSDQNEDRQMIAMRELSIPEKTFLGTSSPARISTDRSIKKLFKS